MFVLYHKSDNKVDLDVVETRIVSNKLMVKINNDKLREMQKKSHKFTSRRKFIEFLIDYKKQRDKRNIEEQLIRYLPVMMNSNIPDKIPSSETKIEPPGTVLCGKTLYEISNGHISERKLNHKTINALIILGNGLEWIDKYEKDVAIDKISPLDTTADLVIGDSFYLSLWKADNSISVDKNNHGKVSYDEIMNADRVLFDISLIESRNYRLLYDQFMQKGRSITDVMRIMRDTYSNSWDDVKKATNVCVHIIRWNTVILCTNNNTDIDSFNHNKIIGERMIIQRPRFSCSDYNSIIGDFRSCLQFVGIDILSDATPHVSYCGYHKDHSINLAIDHRSAALHDMDIDLYGDYVKIDTEKECKICMMESDEKKMLISKKCGHQMCETCTVMIMQGAKTCPFCRGELNPVWKVGDDPHIELIKNTVTRQTIVLCDSGMKNKLRKKIKSVVVTMNNMIDRIKEHDKGILLMNIRYYKYVHYSRSCDIIVCDDVSTAILTFVSNITNKNNTRLYHIK